MKIDLQMFEKKAWQNGFRSIAGVDEAGRGPLAGPVVSAAVMLPPACCITGVNDSKQLTPRKRERLFRVIGDSARSIGIGVVGPRQIDRINILQAARLSMALAVESMNPSADALLIDGTFGIRTPIHQTLIAKGDAKSMSIAAASIVAKVTRDRIMQGYDRLFPVYGFAKHKGYPTKAHRDALRRYGASPIHRKTFKGVREAF